MNSIGDRVVSQRLLLESLKRLIAVRFALRTGIDYRMYQPQLVGTLIARGLYLVEQIIQFPVSYTHLTLPTICSV